MRLRLFLPITLLAGCIVAPIYAQKQSDTPEIPVPEGMVLVSGGSFLMGSDKPDEGFHNQGDATPQHEVELPAFYIDRTEVTNSEYSKYCQATDYPVPPHWINGQFRPEQEQHPVTHINWWEAQAFAKWKGKRLPTEAEWEKAARGTDGRAYPWGSDWDDKRVVWAKDDPDSVGSKPEGASVYGVLDMAGNVYEWTSGWYRAYPHSTYKFAQYGTQYKVIRGGGFDGEPYDTKTLSRSLLRAQSRSSWVGFRCVQDVSIK